MAGKMSDFSILIHGTCIYEQQRLVCSFHTSLGNVKRQLLFWFGLRGDLAMRDFISHDLLL